MRSWMVTLLAAAACAPPPASVVDAPRAARSVSQPVPPAPSIDVWSVCQARTASFIGVMRGRLDVEIYVSHDSAPHAHAGKAVTAQLHAMVPRAAGNLGVELIDTATFAGRALAEQQGINPANVIDGTSAYLGMVLRHGEAKEVIAAITLDDIAVIEAWIAAWARRLAADVEGRSAGVGLVTGKGGVAIDELRDELEALVPYALEEVRLADGVPSHLRVLVVLQSATAFSDEELAAIDSHVMRGGRLAVFASAVDVAAHDARMTAGINAHGIERLLARYGIDLTPAVLIDATTAYALSLPASTDVKRAAAIPVLSAGGDGFIDAAFQPFFQLRALPFPFPSPLSVRQDAQPDARYRVVATTSAASVAHEAPMSLRFDAAPVAGGDPGQKPIAVSIEGTLRSGANATRDARMLVVSASQFLSNPFARAGSPHPMAPPDIDLQAIGLIYGHRHHTHTLMALKGALEWLVGDDEAACNALMAQHADSRADQRPFTRCAPAQVRQLLDESRDLAHVLDVCGGFEDP